MNSNKYPHFSILLVDDEEDWLGSLALTLESSAAVSNLVTCSDSRKVMDILETADIGLILLDLTMPHISGEELLKMISEQHPQITTIVISGLNQIETAVQCMRRGAFDYFVKTDDHDRIIGGVLRAIHMQELQRDHREITSRFCSPQVQHPDAFNSTVTSHRSMHAVFSYVEAVAQSPLPVLIRGESGVGKELIARAAHRLSGCSGKLVTLNAAGLDDNVFADTLFGHVRGAYTGADHARNGMIEEAAEGTLFLDEIGDLSNASQVKLLRLIQEGEYFQLGSDIPKRMKARIIVATHQDLQAMEKAGSFRRDLYYRLRTHQIVIPPLRERKSDLPLLIDHFLDEACAIFNKPKPAIPKKLIQLLNSYNFPGNIRELKAMIFDAVTLLRDRSLDLNLFTKAIELSRNGSASQQTPRQNPFADFEQLPTFNEAAAFLVMDAMSRANNNQTMAARLLGISQPALSKRLKGLQ